MESEKSWEEELKERLEAGERISEHEIESMTQDLEVVYEEEGEDRRWNRGVLTVVDILGDLYAINWDAGLTEMQPNEYMDQPYKVKLEEKEVTYTETHVVSIENE